MDQFNLQSAYEAFMASLGLSHLASASDVLLSGQDPVLASPHRIASAASIAAAAHGCVIDSVWHARTGRRQQIRIHTDEAVNILNSTYFLQQNGYRIGMGSGNYHEPLNTFFRTKDHWFRFVGSRPSHRDIILNELRCANTRTAIAQATASMNALDLEDRCAELGVPGVIARSRQEWRAHPQGKHLNTLPPVQIIKLEDQSQPAPLQAAARPLSGIRVLDMTHVLAGPASTRTLAAQGAQVLRVTSPSSAPDPLYMAIDTGFAKRNAFADLNQPSDMKAVKSLVAGSDVFVQSYRHGSLEARGLSPENLMAIRPGLIYVSISCYGDGPWESRPGFDPNAVTATGISLDEAREGVPSLPVTTLLTDFLTGYLAATGIVAALLRRAQEGGSYHVKVSLARSAMWVQDLGLLPAAMYAGRPAQFSPSTKLATMPSAFGTIGYLAPVPHYSETQARWDSPPRPLGESLLKWPVDKE
ncbi:MAG TPA: CoA transferase [Eoetvoesiella sp.]